MNLGKSDQGLTRRSSMACQLVDRRRSAGVRTPSRALTQHARARGVQVCSRLTRHPRARQVMRNRLVHVSHFSSPLIARFLRGLGRTARLDHMVETRSVPCGHVALQKCPFRRRGARRLRPPYEHTDVAQRQAGGGLSQDRTFEAPLIYSALGRRAWCAYCVARRRRVPPKEASRP